jgi:hypothetical protein
MRKQTGIGIMSPYLSSRQTGQGARRPKSDQRDASAMGLCGVYAVTAYAWRPGSPCTVNRYAVTGLSCSKEAPARDRNHPGGGGGEEGSPPSASDGNALCQSSLIDLS